MGCLTNPHGIPHNIVSDHRTPYNKVNVGMDLWAWDSLVEPHAIQSRRCFPDRESEWSLKLSRHGGWRWGGLQWIVEEGKLSIPCGLENVYILPGERIQWYTYTLSRECIQLPWECTQWWGLQYAPQTFLFKVSPRMSTSRSSTGGASSWANVEWIWAASRGRRWETRGCAAQMSFQERTSCPSYQLLQGLPQPQNATYSKDLSLKCSPYAVRERSRYMKAWLIQANAGPLWWAVLTADLLQRKLRFCWMWIAMHRLPLPVLMLPLLFTDIGS